MILLLPKYKLWGELGHKDGYPYCFIWLENGTVLTDPNKLGHIFGYFSPLFTLVISFYLIRKEMFSPEKEWTVTKTALMVVGSFVFVYTPGFVVYFFNPLKDANFLPGLHVCTYLLGKCKVN